MYPIHIVLTIYIYIYQVNPTHTHMYMFWDGLTPMLPLALLGQPDTGVLPMMAYDYWIMHTFAGAEYVTTTIAASPGANVPMRGAMDTFVPAGGANSKCCVKKETRVR